MKDKSTFTLSFGNQKLTAASGSNLRRVLLAAGFSPHNGAARVLNCRGMGTCGTCAVEVRGAVSLLTAREKWRLNFPPHRQDQNLRLACQCRVMGPVEIKKHPGFWGEKKP